MRDIIFAIILLLGSILLLYTLWQGNQKRLMNITVFTKSIYLVALYNLIMFLKVIIEHAELVLLLEKITPVVTLFLFRRFLLDFYKSIDRRITGSIKSIIIHVVPLIFLFLMSVDFLRGLVNERGISSDIDVFHIFFITTIILYQLAIFFDIMVVNLLAYKKSIPRYRQVYLAHILVNSIYIVITALVFISGKIEDDILVSGVLYTLYLIFLSVNYIRPEWLPHAATERLTLQEGAVKKERAGRMKDRRALDSLTGVFTREYFMKYIMNLDSNDDALGIMIVNITGLKLLNESFGFDVGDDIVQKVSVVLGDVFQNSTIARMSGSVFAVLFSKETEDEIGEKISKIKDICESSEDYIYNLYFGYYLKKTEDLSAHDVFLRAKEELYYNKLIVNQKHQDHIARMLSTNFGRLLPSLHAHLLRCSDLSYEFGRYMGLNEELVQDLKHAAMIHDIALTTMPHIVEYNVAFHDDFERRVYRSHVSKGYDIAIESGINANTAGAVLHHHENYNGSGYPHGLKGEEIPYLSQVVAIVDFVDMVMYYGKKTRHLEKLLRHKIGIEFSTELVYNMIAFLKEKGIIEV